MPKLSEYETQWRKNLNPKTPRSIIQEMMNNRSVTVEDIISISGDEAEYICSVFAGDSPTSKVLAFTLEMIFDKDVEYWLKLDKSYRGQI